jgi:hypothetical protein
MASTATCRGKIDPTLALRPRGAIAEGPYCTTDGAAEPV